MKSKKSLWAIIIIVAIIVCGGYYWYSQIKVPYDAAVTNFQKAAKTVNEKNEVLDSKINNGQKILDSDEKPLDEETFSNLQVSISTAKEAKRNVPSVPKKTADVKKETTQLEKELDYTDTIDNLDKTITSASNSVKQLKQVTNPSGDFIVTRLNEVGSIDGIQAATEENDPNGQLNKDGGYTAAVYFLSPLVDQSKVYGTDTLDKGTDAGGCVEVYKTVEEANKRNDYLKGFDGSVLSSGGHKVIGTVIIRTSDELTATNQKNLETEIENKLTEVQ